METGSRIWTVLELGLGSIPPGSSVGDVLHVFIPVSWSTYSAWYCLPQGSKCDRPPKTILRPPISDFPRLAKLPERRVTPRRANLGRADRSADPSSWAEATCRCRDLRGGNSCLQCQQVSVHQASDTDFKPSSGYLSVSTHSPLTLHRSGLTNPQPHSSTQTWSRVHLSDSPRASGLCVCVCVCVCVCWWQNGPSRVLDN